MTWILYVNIYFFENLQLFDDFSVYALLAVPLSE